MGILKASHTDFTMSCFNDLSFMAVRRVTMRRCLVKLITGIGTDRKNTKGKY